MITTLMVVMYMQGSYDRLEKMLSSTFLVMDDTRVQFVNKMSCMVAFHYSVAFWEASMGRCILYSVIVLYCMF